MVYLLGVGLKGRDLERVMPKRSPEFGVLSRESKEMGNWASDSSGVLLYKVNLHAIRMRCRVYQQGDAVVGYVFHTQLS